MFTKYKLWLQQGRQYIKDPMQVNLSSNYRGLPIVSDAPVNDREVADICPTGAVLVQPLRVDIGKCVFCGECALAFPNKIQFGNQHRMASNRREDLLIGFQSALPQVHPELIRDEIKSLFGRSLKLRQVSAGGDAANELELGATENVNFDMSRYGIEFTASPRHADGLVLTGPITQNMAEALEICYRAIPSPKLLILAGTDAISGGSFAGSPAIDRSFLDRYSPDLYVPGHPIHPLTFISGILQLIRSKKK